MAAFSITLRDSPCPLAVSTERVVTVRARPESLPRRSVLDVRRSRYCSLTHGHRTVRKRRIFVLNCCQRANAWYHHETLPFSESRFIRNHFHLKTSSSVTTRRNSSSVASRCSFTHPGSGQPTRPTSPSLMHNFQKSSRQERQKTCEQESMMQRAPLMEVRHTSQLKAVCENRAASVDLS